MLGGMIPEVLEARTVRVKTWNELQDAVFADSWNDRLGRFRSRFAFRGHSESTYQLATTLIRLGGPYADLEHHLLRSFRKYAHRSVVERDSLWHWLSVAKHYGLPTRLLDWTYSPYVAMHFATANLDRFHADAVIWMVNYVEAARLLPIQMRSRLEQEGASVFTTELLTQSVTTLKELAALSTEDFVAFFEPASLDDRIVNQFALFSMASDPALTLEDWLARHPQLCRRILIPAALKWEIRDKLDQANITERVLFPGLDGLSHWLKRLYSPRDGVPPEQGI